MNTTQAVVGAIKAAGLSMSKIVKVTTSQPHPHGEIVTTTKRPSSGYSVVKMPRGGFAVNYTCADSGDSFDAKIAEVSAALVSRGFKVQAQKAPGMAIVVF